MAMADIVIKNGDATGEGFNDPTLTTPAGGNAADTLGQARLNAFRHAALLIDGMVSSSVTATPSNPNSVRKSPSTAGEMLAGSSASMAV